MEMVLLEIESSDTDPFYSHAIFAGGRSVGVVTSGAYGHRTGKTLALAFLREPEVRQGLEVKILAACVPPAFSMPCPTIRRIRA